MKGTRPDKPLKRVRATVIPPEDVVRFTSITLDHEDVAYDVEFTRIDIRDLCTNRVLFEKEKPQKIRLSSRISLTRRLTREMVRSPYEEHLDSFYFVDSHLIMHNNANYPFSSVLILEPISLFYPRSRFKLSRVFHHSFKRAIECFTDPDPGISPFLHCADQMNFLHEKDNVRTITLLYTIPIRNLRLTECKETIPGKWIAHMLPRNYRTMFIGSYSRTKTCSALLRLPNLKLCESHSIRATVAGDEYQVTLTPRSLGFIAWIALIIRFFTYNRTFRCMHLLGLCYTSPTSPTTASPKYSIGLRLVLGKVANYPNLQWDISVLILSSKQNV
ncbi:unnamed protein product [Heligmosomoides polygyrus]|uniref:GMP_PDE_delta domain-containing protein n=1 Tax=Heligmosomoides polygyrus TaxID=6339 RepID=A0A183F4N1_HELPZ|nr:unnamed protein product [Heligmosomoides polygyrus]